MFDSNDLDIKLPGVNTGSIKFKIPEWLTKNMEIHITGKWFQYGILFIVLLLDLNMWKNQIFYEPILYGQYTGPEGACRCPKSKGSPYSLPLGRHTLSDKIFYSKKLITKLLAIHLLMKYRFNRGVNNSEEIP